MSLSRNGYTLSGDMHGTLQPGGMRWRCPAYVTASPPEASKGSDLLPVQFGFVEGLAAMPPAHALRQHFVARDADVFQHLIRRNEEQVRRDARFPAIVSPAPPGGQDPEGKGQGPPNRKTGHSKASSGNRHRGRPPACAFRDLGGRHLRPSV